MSDILLSTVLFASGIFWSSLAYDSPSFVSYQQKPVILNFSSQTRFSHLEFLQATLNDARVDFALTVSIFENACFCLLDSLSFL
jgi:hypothetical protein